MKKVKIDFDFSKWGQEGISVIIDSKNVFVIHKNPIKTTWYYGLYENGFAFSCLVGEITMYQEIKPREIWVNEYLDDKFIRDTEFGKLMESSDERSCTKCKYFHDMNCETTTNSLCQVNDYLYFAKDEPNETEKV